MATFQVRVEDYTGDIGDTQALSDWLTAGARFVVDLLPEHILNEHSGNVTVTTGGLSVATYRVLKQLKNGYDAPRVDVGLMTAVQDSNSLHYAISGSPVSLIYNKKIYIYPNGGEIIAMVYPTIAYTASTIANFPDRMVHGVILYASIQGAIRLSSDSLGDVGALTIPTAPSAPSFTFTDVTGETVTLPSTPTYTKPTSNASFTNVSTYIATDEDLDMATTEIGHQKTVLEQHQMDLYNELNEFNGEVEVFKSTLQKYVEDARMAQEAGILNSTKELEATVSEYQSELSKYQTEVQAYASQINANVSLTQGYLGLVERLKAEFNEFMQGSIRSDG